MKRRPSDIEDLLSEIYIDTHTPLIEMPWAVRDIWALQRHDGRGGLEGKGEGRGRKRC